MNRVTLYIVSVLFVSWTILLLPACHPSPISNNDNSTKEEDKGDEDEEVETVTPQAFFMPLARFGEQLTPTELDRWAEGVGATLLSTDAEARHYVLPTDTLESMTLHTPRDIYREMTLTVPQHPFATEGAFFNFLRREGFKQSDSYPYLWFNQERGLWMEYYADEELRQDIHYYAGAELTSFDLAFTELRKDVSRSSVREQLMAEGYQYNKEASDLYKLIFDQPEGDWQRVIVFYDKTSEQPAQVQMLARDRYVLRSSMIPRRLKEEGFYINEKRHKYETFSYLHDEKELQVDLSISDNPIEAKVPGGLIISYHANPNAAVEIDRIDFPCFQWGATQEELEAFERQRGREGQMFAGVFNVPTDDKNFTLHAYFFDANGKYNRAEAVVSRLAVIKSKDFVRLMSEAGFDYVGEDKGKIKYFNDRQHIIAVIDLTASTLSITYFPLG